MARHEAAREDGDGAEGSHPYEKYYQEKSQGLGTKAGGSPLGGRCETQQSPEKIANYAWYTFWYVVPTLPMFLIFKSNANGWSSEVQIPADCKRPCIT
ncbi:hypothetical protein JF55_15485 [Pseudomonas sp. 1-7]|jgi:hypothetical protein|nr:hypothetical protein JF55_15485 [Pseudomonas sp. 1-7]